MSDRIETSDYIWALPSALYATELNPQNFESIRRSADGGATWVTEYASIDSAVLKGILDKQKAEEDAKRAAKEAKRKKR